MRVVIAGGAGQVGTLLARAFHAEGHEVVVLSRAPASAQWRVREWDGETLGDWKAELEGADVVINLAGRSVNCRYNSENRRQYVSWIHHRDFVSAIHWLIDRTDFEGAVNLAAPSPLPNAEFMKALRRAWGARIGLPAAAWMLEIGAIFLRTETELILKSRRVVPGRLLREGFGFQFSTWPEAARDLCGRWREQHGRSPS